LKITKGQSEAVNRSLKITQGQSEAVNRRTDNAIAKVETLTYKTL